MLTPTTMTKEYEHLQRVFRWGVQEFLGVNQMGIEAGFVDSDTKKKLRNRLSDAYANLAVS
jgi:hypothetical protein